jgi:hypothetical protein
MPPKTTSSGTKARVQAAENDPILFGKYSGADVSTKARVQVAENDLDALHERELWEAKYRFNKTKLGVADEKAREAADRTIDIVRRARLEFRAA